MLLRRVGCALTLLGRIMVQVATRGVRIEVEPFGPAAGETVLLIMGLGAQLTRWPLGLIDLLTKRGYHVIRFDNRDVGLSQKFHSAGPADLAAVFKAAMAGEKPPSAYTLEDMAEDTTGVLEALSVRRAHIVGASMGGMIPQLGAADYPERALSLTSIMSTSGNPALPPAKPEAMAEVMTPPPASGFEAFVAHGIKARKTIGRSGYPTRDAELRARIIADFPRSHYLCGVSPHIAAIA